ncbi:hypothetical protein LEP1GSC125_1105 [Leptospira mayottensis 200901122]|uniref:Uncharacterized protein n=1 Tax=Leptospira mayottensis 200901122 TaxID=1193010 RepID=A0AA87ML14_9LEPT|nr:hypothetical protein LEP1GSC125_1105 [Leptospira mayottensis 200901122]
MLNGRIAESLSVLLNLSSPFSSAFLLLQNFRRLYVVRYEITISISMALLLLDAP